MPPRCDLVPVLKLRDTPIIPLLPPVTPSILPPLLPSPSPCRSWPGTLWKNWTGVSRSWSQRTQQSPWVSWPRISFAESSSGSYPTSLRIASLVRRWQSGYRASQMVSSSTLSSLCTCACLHTCRCLCACMCVSLCVYVCMCVCVTVCVPVHVCFSSLPCTLTRPPLPPSLPDIIGENAMDNALHNVISRHQSLGMEPALSASLAHDEWSKMQKSSSNSAKMRVHNYCERVPV